jgi:DNA-binding NarL/FixJ family response regulator
MGLFPFEEGSMKPIQLLLVEDHALFRKSMISLLKRESEFQAAKRTMAPPRFCTTLSPKAELLLERLR